MLTRNRIWVVIALGVIASLLLSACGAPAPQVVEKRVVETVVVVVTPTPVPGEEKVTLDTVFGTEPPSMDPALATDSTSIGCIRQMFMGLTGFDEKAAVIPALATEWSASADGLVWTYKLRNDGRWIHRNPVNGEFEDVGPVTAFDVEYGAKRTLDPNSASDYAFVLYILKGGEEFNTADPKAENFEELRSGVGVTAVDTYTVQFTLKEPAGYFPSITGMWVTFPMPQAVIEELGDQWTEAGLIVTNGPYTLEEWSHGAYVRMVKNPLWVGAKDVQIEVIQGPIIMSESTAMAMYEANEIDMMADPGWGPPLPDMDRIKGDPTLSKELFIAPRLCTYYYGFVTTKPPFDKPLVRRAFAAAIDRQSLIDNVTKGNQVPAHSFVCPGIFGNIADDKSIGGWMVMDDYAAQLKQAQQWLAEAGYPEGQGLNVVLMHNVSEALGQVAQAIQAMWKEAFPKANITIETQEWAVYLKTLLPGSPDQDKPNIFRMGWCADYPDANNWLNEVLNSKSSQNYVKFFNPEFDKLVEGAANESDPAKRQEMYKQAEKILIEDETAIAPIYYYTYVRLYKPWITKKVISPVTGDPFAQWRLDWAAKKAALGQ